MSHPTDTYHVLGNLLTFKARNKDTGGFSLVEARTAPGAGAPPNRHPGDDEAFYILSGRYEFTVEGVTRICGPGDYVALPNGAVHSFRNAGDAVASMLIVNWPGTPHEAFFTRVGDPLPAGTKEFPGDIAPPDIPRVLAIGKECGIEFFLSGDAQT